MEAWNKGKRVGQKKAFKLETKKRSIDNFKERQTLQEFKSNVNN